MTSVYCNISYFILNGNWFTMTNYTIEITEKIDLHECLTIKKKRGGAENQLSKRRPETVSTGTNKSGIVVI
jgi:hypothetical protein